MKRHFIHVSVTIATIFKLIKRPNHCAVLVSITSCPIASSELLFYQIVMRSGIFCIVWISTLLSVQRVVIMQDHWSWVTEVKAPGLKIVEASNAFSQIWWKPGHKYGQIFWKPHEKWLWNGVISSRQAVTPQTARIRVRGCTSGGHNVTNSFPARSSLYLITMGFWTAIPMRLWIGA